MLHNNMTLIRSSYQESLRLHFCMQLASAVQMSAMSATIVFTKVMTLIPIIDLL